MEKYIVTSETFDGFIIMSFAPYLVEFTINATIDPSVHQWFLNNHPHHKDQIRQYKKIVQANGTAKIEKYKDELSFEYFWRKYNNKIGNKKRAEAVWNRMNNSQRYKALFYIERYERQLAKNKSIQKLYPETYLTQARWNN